MGAIPTPTARPARRLRPAAASLLLACTVATSCGTRVAGKLRALSAPPSVTTTPTATPTTTTLDVGAAKAQITANWEKFFNNQTSIPDREALLENGAQYDQALRIRSADPLQAQASAKVKSVELTGADRATVTYDVYLKDQVALPGAEGIAVLQGGTWKVSAQSFCSLVTLGATGTIPGCS